MDFLSIQRLPSAQLQLIAEIRHDGSATAAFYGTTFGANVGTLSLPALANTNLHTSTQFLRITSAATANQAAELRGGALDVWRGNAARLGGFCAEFIWAINSSAALQRGGMGFFNTTAALPINAAPSAQLNCIFAGWESSETTLRIRHNDNAGVCTAIDLGANFPINTTAVYKAVFFCNPNDTVINYQVTRLDTGNVASGSISTDLPQNTVFLCPHFWMNNGGTAAAVVLDVRRYRNFNPF